MAIATARDPRQQLEQDAIDNLLSDESSIYGKAAKRLGAQPSQPTTPTATTPNASSAGDGSGIFDGSSLGTPTAKPPQPRTATGPAATTPGEAGPSATTPGASLDTGVTPAPSGSALQMYGTEDIPGTEGMAWGDPNRVTGANTAGWESGERGSRTTKNNFLKIASRYPPNVPGAAQALFNDPDFKRLFPGARLIEHPKGDQIDFGDGPVDVLVNAREGGAGELWAWQPVNEGGAPSGTGAGGTVGPGMPQVPGLTDQSTLDEIMAALDAMATGKTDPLLKQKLDQLLSGAPASVTSGLKGTQTGSTGAGNITAGTRYVGTGGTR